MRRNDFIFKLALTAVFSALAFGLTFVSIPLPTGAKVHLGNFVCVLAGMLCGGIVGGVSGSIGMGLNDIACNYEWDTVLRTFITKFFLGFAVGVLFKLLINRDKATKITLYSLTGVFTAGALGTIIAYSLGNTVYSYVKDGKAKHTLAYKDGYDVVGAIKGYEVNVGAESKMIELSVLVPIFMSVLALLLIGVVVWILVLTYKNKNQDKNRIYRAVATVTSISIIVNTVLEFLLRLLFVTIKTNSFESALAQCITKIPSNLITGTVTLVCVTLVYLPIYVALTNTGYERYIINCNKQVVEA